MSSTSNKSFSTASVFIRLRLKWSLKVKELEPLSTRHVSAVHSNLYKLETIKDLNFCFCLEHPEIWYYKMSVKGYKMWSFELVDTFILIKDRAYGIKPLNKLKFLEYFDSSYIPDDEEYVEVQCIVNICPANPALPVKEDSFLLEAKGIVNLESLPCITLPRNCTNKQVIAFIQRGEFPDLDVDMALQIISESETHKCVELKVLCTEYLMRNVNKDNFQKILRVAEDFGLTDLELSCRVQRHNLE